MDNAAKKEFIGKVKKAKNAEELVSIAKENGIEVTEEAAQCYFCRRHREGELSDEELKNVVGGDDDCKTILNTNWQSLGAPWISQPCNNFMGFDSKSCENCLNHFSKYESGHLICTMEDHS